MEGNKSKSNFKCLRDSHVLLSKKLGKTSLRSNEEYSKAITIEHHNCHWIKAKKVIEAHRDSILIFGKDKKGNLHSVRTDRKGRLQVEDVHRDKNLIFGKDKDGKLRPVRTDKKGRIQVVDTRFKEFTQKVEVGGEWCALPPFDVSKFKVYSIAVVNKTANDAEVKVQISPNDKDYFTDLPPQPVPGCEMNVFVPKRFLKFVRIVTRTVDPCDFTKLKIFLQIQM